MIIEVKHQKMIYKRMDLHPDAVHFHHSCKNGGILTERYKDLWCWDKSAIIRVCTLYKSYMINNVQQWARKSATIMTRLPPNPSTN
jgi:hypothetical protein